LSEQYKESGDEEECEFTFILQREQSVARMDGNVCPDKENCSEKGDQARPETHHDSDAATEFAETDETHESLHGKVTVEEPELLKSMLEEEKSHKDAKNDIEGRCASG
jgi:hypothetical protein